MPFTISRKFMRNLLIGRMDIIRIGDIRNQAAS